MIRLWRRPAFRADLTSGLWSQSPSFAAEFSRNMLPLHAFFTTRATSMTGIRTGTWVYNALSCTSTGRGSMIFVATS